MQLVQVIERMAESNETRLECGQIERFERQRLQVFLGLSGSFNRRVVTEGFPDEPAADSVDRTVRKLQERSPGGLERDRRSRFGKGGIETADSRLAAFTGYPNEPDRSLILNVAIASTPSGSE